MGFVRWGTTEWDAPLTHCRTSAPADGHDGDVAGRGRRQANHGRVASPCGCPDRAELSDGRCAALIRASAEASLNNDCSLTAEG